MRQDFLVLGTILLLTAVGITLNSWSAVVDLGARQRAFDEVRVGMTVPEVEAIMGSRGEQQLRFISGPPKYWAEVGVPLTYRWEDADTIMDVTFQGPRGTPPAVVSRKQERKESPDLVKVWLLRVALLILCAFGFGLVARGLLRREPPPSA